MKGSYFERSSPAAAGADGQLLAAALKKLAAPRYGAKALMVLKGGKVIAEQYRAPYLKGTPHSMFSVSKSFTAVAIGFAAQEGLLGLEDRVADFFPEYLPAGNPGGHMGEVTVRHLLMMAAGFDAAPDQFARRHMGRIVNDFPYSYADLQYKDEIDWAKDFLRGYVAEAPGQRFIYSSACTYMLSAILQKVTGQRTAEFLEPRLFAPLEIELPPWQQCEQGRNVGGWGMQLNSEDLAKFGQFMLQQGSWQGTQLLNPDFIREMTSPQVPTGNRSAKWEKHIGYQVWILGEEGAYGGIGAFGQMYIVLPKQDAVFVMLGASRMYMKALDIILGELPQALSAGGREGQIPGELEPLGLPIGVSSWELPAMRRYAGRYVFGTNLYGIDALTFGFGAEDSLTIEMGGRKSTLPIGCGYWEYGKTPAEESVYTDTHDTLIYTHAACAGGWDQEGEYRLNLSFCETCYALDLRCSFTSHGVQIKVRRNVGFVGDANCTLIGMKAE